MIIHVKCRLLRSAACEDFLFMQPPDHFIGALVRYYGCNSQPSRMMNCHLYEDLCRKPHLINFHPHHVMRHQKPQVSGRPFESHH